MKIIKLFICLLFVSFLVNESDAQQIRELGNALSSLKLAPDVTARRSAENLSELAYDAVPTIYYQNGQFTRIGEEQPVRLITDVKSLQFFKSSNGLYDHVQMICIKIQNEDDFKMSLNFSDLFGFVNLRYVWFQLGFNICADQSADNTCVVKKVSEMIKSDTGTDVNIFYSINIDN